MTNSEGNTVKVKTSAGTTVNKTVKSSVKGIHPGETVTITGETGSGGSLSAESINVGSGGGLAALFGGSAPAAARARARTAAAANPRCSEASHARVVSPESDSAWIDSAPTHTRKPTLCRSIQPHPEDCYRQRSSMPHANTRNRKPAVAAVVVLLLACLGLAACGSSSSSTTSSSANAASTGVRFWHVLDGVHVHHAGRPGLADAARPASRRCANACRRTASRFPSAPRALVRAAASSRAPVPCWRTAAAQRRDARAVRSRTEEVRRRERTLLPRRRGAAGSTIPSSRRRSPSTATVCVRTASTCPRRTPRATARSSTRRGSTPPARSSRPLR